MPILERIPPLPGRVAPTLRQLMAYAFAGLAMHSMLVHGIDQWSVILAAAALGIHPEIIKAEKE